MTTDLYSEVKGKGLDVVLLHGWGMHGGLWGSFNDSLAAEYCTHALDLPGFGFSKDIKNEFTLDAYSEVVETYLEKLNRPVILIGWSLGGLIALNILKRQNSEVNKVIFIASTPCFTKKENWTAAIEQSVFDQFSTDLQDDYKKTLKRFLSLQTRGSGLAREDLRELNKKLNERGDPDMGALKSGLSILSNADLRSTTLISREHNETPVLTILGEKDTLVPVAVSSEFEKIFPNLEQLILDKTGHAPFISSPEICAKTIKNFINE